MINNIKELTRKAREEVPIEKVLTYYNVPMKQISGNTFVMCPFHPDTHPSASIYKTKNKLKCFVCGQDKSYSTLDVAMEKGNIKDLFEAVMKVLEIGGMGINIEYNNDLTLKNESDKQNNDFTSRDIFDNYSKVKTNYQIEYLKNRGLFLYERDSNQYNLKPINNILKYNNIEIRHNYYNGVNNIVYKFEFNNKYSHPWEDVLNYDYFYISKKINTVKGDKFKTRNGGQPLPKFIMLNKEDLNPLETNNIYITEGLEDALSIVQGKFANAITLNSVSNTHTLIQIIEDNIWLFKNFRFVIATDCDKAGIEAKDKLIEFFKKNNLKCNIYNVLYDYNKKNPNIKDVNDLWKGRFKR